MQRQKEIYFSLSDIPKQELEAEIHRTMETQHLSTEGQAMIYLLDKSIAYIPQVNGIVSQAAKQAGVSLPPTDPIVRAEDQIEIARELQALRKAREEIAKLEAGTSQ